MSDQTSLDSLFRLVHGLKRQMYKRAEQLNLEITPMHIRVIKIIDRKQPCTAIDISSLLGRDKAQVTRLVNTMIDKGLLVRAPNPHDKRSHYLTITEAGSVVVKEIRKIHAETFQLMTENLTPDEVTDFQRIAALMANNLDGEND